jgi:hypothetical protein
MAKLREDQGLVTQNHDGVVLAHFSAASAAGTLLHINLGNKPVYIPGLADFRPQKEMGVGGLDITVQEGNILLLLSEQQR